MRPRARTARRDLAPDRTREPAIVEERHVLRPGQPDHHPQPVGGRLVEHVVTRDRIGPDGIDTVRGHRREIRGDAFLRRELRPVRHRREGAIGDALDRKRASVGIQEFPANSRSRPSSGRTNG